MGLATSDPMAMPHGLACLTISRRVHRNHPRIGVQRRHRHSVVGHLLAVQLLSVRQATRHAGAAIEGGRLVRILPLSQAGHLLPRTAYPCREAGALTQITDDVSIQLATATSYVAVCDERRRGKPLPLCQCEAPGTESLAAAADLLGAI